MLKNSINTLLIGGSGLVSTEAIPNVIDVVVSQPSEVVSILVQIIIGIATLFGLFKRKKVAN